MSIPPLALASLPAPVSLVKGHNPMCPHCLSVALALGASATAGLSLAVIMSSVRVGLSRLGLIAAALHRSERV